MTTSTVGRTDPLGSGPSRGRGVRATGDQGRSPRNGGSLSQAGRRNGRRVAFGLLLVVATVVVFWQVDLRRHASDSYLATARAVAVGQVLTDGDLAVVRVSNASGLALMPAARRADVVGRTATVPLAAGSPLTAAQVGPAAWPPAGQAVIAVPVKPGRAPASLAAGSRVVVLVTPSNGPVQTAGATTGDTGTRRATGTVVSSVEGGEQVGSQLVTLLLAAGEAERIASASGEVSLVQLGPGA